jgi:hypothetical protein
VNGKRLRPKQKTKWGFLKHPLFVGIIVVVIGGLLTFFLKNSSTQASTTNGNVANSNTVKIGGNNSGQVAGGNLINQTTVINSNTVAATTGALTPQNGGPVTDDAGYSMSFDGENSIMQFYSPIGREMLPLGPNVPFWISKNRDGLLINAEVKSMDGKIMAELVNNEWRVNPHNYFKLNFDKSGLEIIDDYNIPWLQIDYLTPSSLKIGGVFRGGENVDSQTFPNFDTAAAFRGSIWSVGAGGTIIMGDGQMITRGGLSVETEAQKQTFANEVRDVIEPWFDYTPSKGLGVRLPADPKVTTDPSSVNIPLSKISGMLEGQNFSCAKVVLGIMRGSLILTGTDADDWVEVSLKLNWSMNPSGQIIVPINQKIPVQNVMLFWKNGDATKNDMLRKNSVVSVEFVGLNGNQMQGKFYLESTLKQQTKLLGTFEAEIQK